MSTTTANIMVGAATVSVGAWVTAGGAGSLTDVGHTKTPVTLTGSFEDFELVSERAGGVMSKINTMTRFKLKVPIIEATVDHYMIALRQLAANRSGVPPDETVLVGAAGPTEKYHQISLVGPGLGTLALRTVTFWRGTVESVSEIPFAKGAEQLLEVVFDILWDGTVATADKFFKIIET